MWITYIIDENLIGAFQTNKGNRSATESTDLYAFGLGALVVAATVFVSVRRLSGDNGFDFISAII